MKHEKDTYILTRQSVRETSTYKADGVSGCCKLVPSTAKCERVVECTGWRKQIRN